MKIRILLITLLLSCTQLLIAQSFLYKVLDKAKKTFGSQESDMILKRDGSETAAKVRLVTSDYTYYSKPDVENADELVVDNREVYMIRLTERGNLFFSSQGDIFFGIEPDDEISKDATLLYLVKGEEIGAYDVTTDGQIYKFYLNKKKTDFKTLPRSEVFAIKFPNRPNEVVTPYSNIKEEGINIKELPLPNDDFIELKEQKPAQEYVIRTKKNMTIQALVIYGNEKFVSYYRKEAENGPLYRISRNNIKSIAKAPSRRIRKK